MNKRNFDLRECGDEIKELFDFTLIIFNEIFVSSKGEDCVIFNDPESEDPMLITNTTPIQIRLRVSEESYWDQVLYQLSHELIHYILRQEKEDKTKSVKWFEETLCEAFSLHFLHTSSLSWRECGLYNKNNNYFSSISRYYREELSKTGDRISNCKTISCLKEVNRNAEEHREWRYDIRNDVFELFKEYPNDIKQIINYPKYIKSDCLTIDFQLWRKESRQHPLVGGLAKTQPVMEKE